MVHPVRLGREVHAFIALLRVFLLDMVARQLHLDDMRAGQRGHMRGISTDIERQLTRFGQITATRIGPENRRNADRRRFGAQLANFLDHAEAIVGAGIDGEPDGRATKTQRIIDAAGNGAVLRARPAVGAVALQNGRNLSRKRIRSRFQRTQRRGISIQPGIDRQLIMVMRVIAFRIGREAACRAMFEALVNRQDDHLARAAKFALHQDAVEIGFYARTVGLILFQDFFDFRCNRHRVSLRTFLHSCAAALGKHLPGRNSAKHDCGLRQIESSHWSYPVSPKFRPAVVFCRPMEPASVHQSLLGLCNRSCRRLYLDKGL